MPNGFWIALFSGLFVAALCYFVAALAANAKKRKDQLDELGAADEYEPLTPAAQARFIEIDFGETAPAHKARRLHS